MNFTEATSLVIGLGVSYLLYNLIQKRNCIILDSSKMNELVNKIHKHENKCFTYNTSEIDC